MSKHGGSPLLGLAPAGMEQAQPAPGSMILEPEVAKENRNAKERALQFERRRLALAILPSILGEGDSTAVATSLEIADDLLKQTGGHV